MRHVIFLDRDGVLNAPVVRGGKPYPPASLAETRLLPGVREATKLLHDSGLLLAVISNQPDVARGTQQRANVEAINDWLARQLPIERFDVCYHDDTDNCNCRKPRPGLILRAAQCLNAEIGASFVVGDRWRDIDAGKAAGCRSIWVDRGYAEKAPIGHDYRARSLLDAAQWILKHLSPFQGEST